jgi:hypothetical protein
VTAVTVANSDSSERLDSDGTVKVVSGPPGPIAAVEPPLAVKNSASNERLAETLAVKILLVTRGTDHF